jgi:RNA polymerase sigma factor (sigma-70 family)
MSQELPPDRLSRISTWWTILQQALAGEGGQGAREWFVQRYGKAVRAYLRAVARDSSVAEDLFQEFMTSFLSGKYQRARPDRDGRFRNYLKTCLRNLACDHARDQARRRLQPLPADWDPADPRLPLDIAEKEVDASLRMALLERALQSLESEERRQKKKRWLYTVLRLALDNPQASSARLAEMVGPVVGQPVDDGWVRKRLHYARARFAELLIDEVAELVEPVTAEAVEQELCDLGLREYCPEIPGRPRRP